MKTQDASQPYVLVATLNWNGGADIMECIAALNKMDYPNFQVIVVDNGSTDGSLAEIRTRYPNVAIQENGRNLGYAEGCNVGLRSAWQAGATYALLVNSDTKIDPGALSALVAAAEEDTKITLVTGKVYWYNQPDVLQTAGRYTDPIFLCGKHVASGEVDRGQCESKRDFDYVDDVYLLVRCSVFAELGGYSALFPVYFGITDLCARVRRAGYRIVYTPDSKIWHKGIIGNENVQLNGQRTFYIQYHQVPFMWRNASPQQWSAYLRRTTVNLPIRTLRFIKHGEFGRMWGYLKGVAYGLVWLCRHPRRPVQVQR